MAKKIKKPYEQSETVSIKRSMINFDPYNPKDHTQKKINEQKKNILKNGLLGGIIWNEKTGNLVDGHKRVMSTDIINKYDGTPEKDYIVKVEKVNFDDKTEREQNIFQTKSRTELSLDLVKEFYSDIDPRAAGLTGEDIQYLSPAPDPMPSPGDVFENSGPGIEKEEKPKKEPKKSEDDGLAFFTINFENFQEKREFMESRGVDPYSTFMPYQDFKKLIEPDQ